MKMEPAPAVPAFEILVEKDVDVPMRDGARLKADVFRPDDAGKFPAILNLGPYQKDKLWIPPDTLEEKPNPLMNWETVNPQWWVPRGYAAVRVDGRGSGKSPGQCEPWSLAESIDFYDAIEWAAAQPWCNGAVGLSGISYFAINQWFVANHQPPSLKAIIPWEGFADLYRDALFHGGILSLFMSNWFTAHLMHHVVGRASRHTPNAWQTNTLHFWLSNNLDSGAFRGAQAQWDRITVPMFTVGNWSVIALHLRGNTEAFMRAASKHKKLRIHAGTHVHPFYTEEGRADQLRFFDYWLKAIDNGVMDEPPVPQYVEITGPVAAVLWVSSATEDMDLFLTLRNIDADGNEVLETGQQGTPVPVAKGWLRVSHRELDPDLSLPYRPYHKHTRRLYLTPGEIVQVQVEIWPTSMVFRKGHRIRLDVQPRDGVGSQSYMHYHADYNTGANTIHAGGDRESYLLLPVIPAKS